MVYDYTMEMKTELKDRILFFDGTSAFEPPSYLSGLGPGHFLEKILRYGPDSVFSTKHQHDTDEVGVEVKEDSDPLPNIEWNIPEKYRELDVYQEIYESAAVYGNPGIDRVEAERIEFEKRDMIPLLRVLVYIRDELKRQDKVWGVGRGSSCALFTLFLLGIHSVNSLDYNLPMDEFFR